MLDDDPVNLLACMNVEAGWLAWSCEQVLRHAALTPETVTELNRRGGALFPVLMDDLGKAEDMLVLFLSRGVDVNAGDQEAQDWTALHSFASDGDRQRAGLLLEHGARVDVRATNGLTPLDVARKAQARRPDDPRTAEMIRLLKAAGRASPP